MTPLDHNDVDEACDGLIANAACWLAAVVIAACLFAIASNANAQHYDATASRPAHESLGFYDSGKIQRMTVLYEADLFFDRKNMDTHAESGELPNSDKYQNKLKRKPRSPVFLNLESKVSDAYLAIIIKHLQEGQAQREWWLYKIPYAPRSRFEWSVSKAISEAHAVRDAEYTPLITGFAVQCYERWGIRYATRNELKAIFARTTGKPILACYKAAYPVTNTKQTNKPFALERLQEDIPRLAKLFDGVVLWSPPSGYEPEELQQELALSRIAALTIMDK